MHRLLPSVVLAFALATTIHATEGRSPDQVVANVATQLLKDLGAHRDEYRSDPTKLQQLFDRYLLPNFDVEYSARLVLGRHWREATPQQRKQFAAAFYRSFIRNYGNAILDFSADNLKIFPYSGNSADTRATVRSEVRRSNGERVRVNYSLHKTTGGWKAWDVTIEGVSYVNSFRADFDSEIEQRGLDELIERLASQ